MTLLTLKLGSLNAEPLFPVLQQTLQTVDSRLYIVIYLTSQLYAKLNTPAKRAAHFKPLHELVSTLYLCTASKVTVSSDIIFADWCGYDLADEVWDYTTLSVPESSSDVVNRLPRSTMSVHMITYLSDTDMIVPKEIDLTSEEKPHNVVVVGGTFDHLHPGHKILLSMTAFITSRKLVCGITDDTLLKNKKYAQFLEPLSLRIENVRKFLKLIARNLELQLIPIMDVYGPTSHDNNISAIVISEETQSGANSIAELRKEKNLQQLEVFVINVIGERAGKLGLEEMAREKMSSTRIRERLFNDSKKGS